MVQFADTCHDGSSQDDSTIVDAGMCPVLNGCALVDFGCALMMLQQGC